MICDYEYVLEWSVVIFSLILSPQQPDKFFEYAFLGSNLYRVASPCNIDVYSFVDFLLWKFLQQSLQNLQPNASHDFLQDPTGGLYRNARSVQWGPWAEVGMAVQANTLGRAKSMGSLARG